MDLFPSPSITWCENTAKEAEEFRQKFFEGNLSKSNLKSQSLDEADDSDKILKKSHLLMDVNKDWQNLKYLIKIKVGMINRKEEKQDYIDAEINILQAAVIKQDIEKVKCITSLAKLQGSLDDLLQAGMKCKLKGEMNKILSKYKNSY